MRHRSGTPLPAREFIEAVSNAYHEVQVSEYGRSLPGIANQVPAALQRFLPYLPPKIRLLDFGCGTGFLASLLVASMAERLERVVCADPSPHMLAKCREYLGHTPAEFLLGSANTVMQHGKTFNVVSTCSVLHHLPDLDEFFSMLELVLEDGGVYLMFHEPSADVPAQVQALAIEYRRHTERMRLLRFFNPAAYFRKLARMVSSTPDFHGRVNRILLGRGTMELPLAPQEIDQLVDIHDPANEPEEMGIGQSGFAATEISKRCPSLRLLAVHAYGYLGDVDESAAPRRWQRKAGALKEKLGDPGGALFSAVYQRAG